jgi:type II secretory pathway predicted ATPase ExeA
VRTDTMDYYGITKDFSQAGFFETESINAILRDLKSATNRGGLVAIAGLSGSGKTVSLWRLQEEMAREGKIILSRSLFVEKERVTLASLINALFFDLSPKKDVLIPSQGERRERGLQELMKQGKKPVALFIDEAHELHSKTLKGLKRLIEVVKQSGNVLTVVLIGHPKLKNDLERPTMAEIGHRTKIYTFDGVADSRREFIEWLLDRCSDEKTSPEDIIQAEAIELIAERSATALQIHENLARILVAGHETGERPISAALVESILTNDHSAWVATITRHGYDVRSLSDFLNIKQSEVKQLFAGQLDPMRATELNEQLKVAGLPGR